LGVFKGRVGTTKTVFNVRVSIERKRRLHADLLSKLTREREALFASQKEAARGVVHEDNRAESDKDMRSTEASYLARGQALRVQALDEDLAKVSILPVRPFAPEDPIALSALVTLESGATRSYVYLAPAGGGTRLEDGARVVQVVTPASPMGRALLGAHVDDDVELARGGATQTLTVLAVE
jgi:transcription elongation GreA/GreB family factor